MDKIVEYIPNKSFYFSSAAVNSLNCFFFHILANFGLHGYRKSWGGGGFSQCNYHKNPWISIVGAFTISWGGPLIKKVIYDFNPHFTRVYSIQKQSVTECEILS